MAQQINEEHKANSEKGATVIAIVCSGPLLANPSRDFRLGSANETLCRIVCNRPPAVARNRGARQRGAAVLPVFRARSRAGEAYPLVHAQRQ